MPLWLFFLGYQKLTSHLMQIVTPSRIIWKVFSKSFSALKSAGLIKEGQQLAAQYDDLHELVSHLSEAVSDISHLYFTALTISIKLRAMIQFPVTIDVNTLMEEVQQRMVAMADWPRWISDRLFRQSTMEGVGV